MRNPLDGVKFLDRTIRDMFDTMTMTKIGGGLFGMFLVFLLGKWAAEITYHVGADGHGDGHGEEAHYAYVIEVPEGDDHGGVEVVEVPFAEVYATADVSAGEKHYKACGRCHVLGDISNGKTGPTLDGIVGRAVASIGGFKYSGNLIAVVDTWTPEALNGFLENPKAYAPGTKMVFKGIKDVQDRADLIAWLDSVDG